MRITYLGHSCFAFTAKDGTKIITDPYQGVGYSLPSGLSADIVTLSHGHFDHNFAEGVAHTHLVTKAGEIVVKGVKICGIPTYHDEKQGTLRGENVVYIFEVDGVKICHMGDIGEPVSSSLQEKLGKIDILCIPVGGTYTVDGEGAKAYIDALQPKTVLPMHYKPADGSLDIQGIAPFLKLFTKEELEKIVYMQRGDSICL